MTKSEFIELAQQRPELLLEKLLALLTPQQKQAFQRDPDLFPLPTDDAKRTLYRRVMQKLVEDGKHTSTDTVIVDLQTLIDELSQGISNA